ncbi:MAG: hypothetical protein WB586_30010 [Chthoniobacterales bacterium]
MKNTDHSTGIKGFDLPRERLVEALGMECIGCLLAVKPNGKGERFLSRRKQRGFKQKEAKEAKPEVLLSNKRVVADRDHSRPDGPR